MKDNKQVSDDERAHIASKFLKKTATAGVVGGIGIAKYINKLRDRDNNTSQMKKTYDKLKEFKGQSKEDIENDMLNKIRRGSSSVLKLYDDKIA